MKCVILIVSFLSLVGDFVNGFPTFPPEVASKLSEELRGLVHRRAERRLVFDPRTTPIDGKEDFSAFRQFSVLTLRQ